MKTLTDIWLLQSGGYIIYFDTRSDAMKALSDTSFLEEFPDDTVFTLTHGYQITDYEPKTLDYQGAYI